MVTRDVLMKTAINGIAIMILGIQFSQKGPAFIDLIEISGTDVQGSSVYVTGANTALMLGSTISGYLYSRVKTTSLTMALTLVLTGLLCGATPWCTHFITMLLVISANYVFVGVYEATTCTEQMRICDGVSDWAMLFLSFCFSLGGFIGPLIMEPFLDPKDTVNSTEYDVLFNYMNLSSGLDLDIMFPNMSDMMSSDNLTLTLNQKPANGRDKRKGTDSETAEYPIRYAFLITAVFGVLVSIPYFVQSFRSRNKEHKKEKSRARSTSSSRKLPKKAYLTVVVTASIYYFLFTAFEDFFVNYLSYFVVKHLDWSKQDGALVMSVYWIFSACVKVALIFLSLRVDNGTILLICNIGMVISSLGFTVVSQLHVHSMVWVFTALTASSVSALFGGAMAWVDGTLLQMDGKATASLLISASLGATLMPIPTGTMMKNWSTMAFPYLMFGLAVLDILFIIVLLFGIKPHILKKYGPPRPDVDLELEAVPQMDGTNSADGVSLQRVSSRDNNTQGHFVTEKDT